VYASSFFIERITTSIVYTDMLQHLLSPPINKDETEQTTTQQDDRPHFHTKWLKFICSSLPCQGTRCCSWLRHYISRQKTAGLIPGGQLGLLTEMNTRDVSWGV